MKLKMVSLDFYSSARLMKRDHVNLGRPGETALVHGILEPAASDE
jgi:hypothetical protein